MLDIYAVGHAAGALRTCDRHDTRAQLCFFNVSEVSFIRDICWEILVKEADIASCSSQPGFMIVTSLNIS